MVKADPEPEQSVSHNLLGQRLGRKGRDTRERILAATERLLAQESDTPISLSAVAREASLGMTTLYLYFSDLTELILAVLNSVMASAQDSYVGLLRTRWGDAELGARCLAFVDAYLEFWRRHARILHLRNSYVDAGEHRVREHRIEVSMPVISALVEQMNGDPKDRLSASYGMAIALLTGLERTVTVTTEVGFASMTASSEAHVSRLLKAQARLLELGIRDCRQAQQERG